MEYIKKERGVIYNFMYSPEILEYAMTNKEYPPMLTNVSYRRMHPELEKEMIRAEKDLYKCDDWLRKIGFYNDFDESNYSCIINISSYKELSEPQDIKTFKNKSGEAILKAPKNFCYVL